MDQKEQKEFFHEIFHASLPRLGPGDDASTLKALEQLLAANPRQKEEGGRSRLRVLDIGCGNGSQTLQLAKHIDCDILAVDNHQPFLDELNRRAKVAGLSGKIRTRLMSMNDLSPSDGIFDLIWSEGALGLFGYSDGVVSPSGFRDGLTLCDSMLPQGGSLAVSELCWFRPDPPAECLEFFQEAYPPMVSVDANLRIIESCGIKLIGHFTLPESAWLDSFYNHLDDRLRSLRDRYAADNERLCFIESIQKEIDMYRKYSSYYGYSFFLMRSRQD